MDLDNLLRTYLHLNDDKYRGVTYKFAAFALIAVLALSVSYWAGSADQATRDAGLGAQAEGGGQAAAGDGASGQATAPVGAIYIGFDAAEFNPATDDPRAMLDSYLADHPTAVVVQTEKVGELTIGYWVLPE